MDTKYGKHSIFPPSAKNPVQGHYQSSCSQPLFKQTNNSEEMLLRRFSVISQACQTEISLLPLVQLHTHFPVSLRDKQIGITIINSRESVLHNLKLKSLDRAVLDTVTDLTLLSQNAVLCNSILTLQV